MHPTRRKVRGFTLVEALVALLALSIGLLGVAALQMTGLRNNLSAAWRSQATYLAYDIIDRMRANRGQAAAYNVSYGAYGGSGSVATNDLTSWKGNLTTVLPEGDGSVVVTPVATPNGTLNTVTVTIKWRDSENPSEAALEFETRSII